MKHLLIILLLLPAVIKAQSDRFVKDWLNSTLVPSDSMVVGTAELPTFKYDTVKSYMLTSGRYVRMCKGYCVTYKGWCVGRHLNKCRKTFRRLVIVWACRQFNRIYVTH